MIANGVLSLGGDNSAAVSFSGPISGAGSLLKIGLGTQTLSGDNTYAGATTINAGAISVPGVANSGVSSSLGAGSSIVLGNATDPGRLIVTASTAQSSNRPIVLGAASGIVEVTNAGTNLTLSGSIGGIGSLTKAGPGTVTLSNPNNYAGATVISQGDLVAASLAGSALPNNLILGNGTQRGVFLIMGASNQFGPNSVLTFNNGTGRDAKFELRGTNQTVAGLSSDADDTLLIIQNQETGTPGPATLTINNTGNFVWNGIFRKMAGDALDLVKNGPGTQEFRNVSAQTNNFRTLTINAGRMTFNYSGATGAIVAGTIAVNALGQLGLDGTWTLSRPVSGAGNISKLGSGTVILSGANSITGGITIADGTLQVANSGSYGVISVGLSGLSGTAGTFNIQGGSAVSGTDLTMANIPAANTGTVTITDPGSALTLTGTATIGAASASSGTVNVQSGGTFTTGIGLTTVNATGTLAIAGGTVKTNGLTLFHPGATLSITAGGKLDVTNQKLILQNGDIGAWNGTKFTGVTGLVQSGYNGGAWNGSGIMTSAITPSTALGVARADQVGLAGGTFGGIPVAGTDVLVGLTLVGDANLDRIVDFKDLVKVAQNYGATSGKLWSEGNFNYDANVDFSDLVKVAQNYGTALPAQPVPGASAELAADPAAAFAEVPEPTLIGLVGTGVILLSRRRSRIVR